VVAIRNSKYYKGFSYRPCRSKYLLETIWGILETPCTGKQQCPDVGAGKDTRSFSLCGSRFGNHAGTDCEVDVQAVIESVKRVGLGTTPNNYPHPTTPTQLAITARIMALWHTRQFPSHARPRTQHRAPARLTSRKRPTAPHHPGSLTALHLVLTGHRFLTMFAAPIYLAAILVGRHAGTHVDVSPAG